MSFPDKRIGRMSSSTTKRSSVIIWWREWCAHTQRNSKQSKWIRRCDVVLKKALDIRAERRRKYCNFDVDPLIVCLFDKRMHSYSFHSFGNSVSVVVSFDSHSVVTFFSHWFILSDKVFHLYLSHSPIASLRLFACLSVQFVCYLFGRSVFCAGRGVVRIKYEFV